MICEKRNNATTASQHLKVKMFSDTYCHVKVNNLLVTTAIVVLADIFNLHKVPLLWLLLRSFNYFSTYDRLVPSIYD